MNIKTCKTLVSLLIKNNFVDAVVLPINPKHSDYDGMDVDADFVENCNSVKFTGPTTTPRKNLLNTVISEFKNTYNIPPSSCVLMDTRENTLYYSSAY